MDKKGFDMLVYDIETRIRAVEIFGVLLWLSFAASPLAFLDYHRRVTADRLCYPPAIFALCFLGRRLIDQTVQAFERLSFYCRLTLIPKVLFTIVTAVCVSVCVMENCSQLEKKEWSYWSALSLLPMACHFGWQGLRPDSYLEDVLLAAWFVFACLTNVLLPQKKPEFSLGNLFFSRDGSDLSMDISQIQLESGPGLYFLVHVLWTYSYLFDVIWT